MPQRLRVLWGDNLEHGGDGEVAEIWVLVQC